MVALWPALGRRRITRIVASNPTSPRYRAWMTDMLHYGLGVWIVIAVDGDEDRRLLRLHLGQPDLLRSSLSP